MICTRWVRESKLFRAPNKWYNLWCFQQCSLANDYPYLEQWSWDVCFLCNTHADQVQNILRSDSGRSIGRYVESYKVSSDFAEKTILATICCCPYSNWSLLFSWWWLQGYRCGPMWIGLWWRIECMSAKCYGECLVKITLQKHHKYRINTIYTLQVMEDDFPFQWRKYPELRGNALLWSNVWIHFRWMGRFRYRTECEHEAVSSQGPWTVHTLPLYKILTFRKCCVR